MNKNILVITILAVLAGVGGGFLGGIINYNYFPQNFYKYPFLTNTNFSNTGINKSDFVIEGAEKLIVEQNEQISKSVDSVKNNLVAIVKYKKLDDKKEEKLSTSSLKTAIKENKFYNPKQRIGEGIIITGDGWIMTNTAEIGTPEQIKKDYRVITLEGEIFEIDKVIIDKKNNISFLHLKEAEDLPAIELADGKEIKVGDLVFAANGERKTLVTNIVGKDRKNELIKFSDEINIDLKIRNNPGDFFDKNAFIFNLDGQLVGTQTISERIIPIEQLRSDIQSLLEFNEIKKGQLGVYYINLASVKMNEKYPNKGALIYPNSEGKAFSPNSPAQKAGLKEGDIILSVNNQPINKSNDLASIIQDHLPGDELDIYYARGDKESRVSITLKQQSDQ
jgi:S1-C subfamily serine protease